MFNIHSIYCDFDGTITKQDTVNSFFDKYASKKWLVFENKWIEGEISSQENAISQVNLLRRVPEKKLNDFINNIEIDEYFLEFIDYIREKNIKFTILSDGFDLFIQKTLERFKLNDIPFYANHVVYNNEKFSIQFPYHNPSCEIGAGMCKCNKIKEEKFCYIGDGTSDLCVAKKADLLFATKKLHKYCEDNLIKNYEFNSFRNIIDMLEEENFFDECS